MTRLIPVAVLVTALPVLTRADELAAPLSSLARLPVREVTVFKDGHAFVLHRGMMPTDASGRVLMDMLPTPVMGTFWPVSMDRRATLTGTSAGRRRVEVERTALTVLELIEGNRGADVVITDNQQKQFSATIVKLLARSAEELALTDATAAEHLPKRSNLVLLKTIEGTRVMPVEQIAQLKFVGEYKTKSTDEEYRNLLTMQLDWGGKPPEKTVEVGMGYLQKGFRWIPQYRIELDAKGKATVRLQATLLNELADLENATLHLVIGVPSFHFKDTTDPIALNQTLATLSPYFNEGPSTQFALSNSMMTQVARQTEVRANAPAPNLGPAIDNGGKAEDLFIFTVKNITLKKGQRMVLPVSQMTLDYKDHFVLNVPFAPPREMRQVNQDPRVTEMLRLLHAPKVMHQIRLTNSSDQPLTTAPAMILKEGKLLAQGMMTYTGRGAAVDLTVTAAVDIKVRKTDRETKRTANAAVLNGDHFFRVDAAGTITLSNHRGQPVEVEVIRYVLGNVGEADEEGRAEMVNAFEDDEYIPAMYRPAWWPYYSWPGWWSHFNGIGRISWTRKLEPGQSIDLKYNWHYYWR